MVIIRYKMIPHWPARTCAVATCLFLSACAMLQSDAKLFMYVELRDHAAEDMDCGPETLWIGDAGPADHFVVKGCGQLKAYACKNTWTDTRPADPHQTRWGSPWESDPRPQGIWGDVPTGITRCREVAGLGAHLMREQRAVPPATGAARVNADAGGADAGGDGHAVRDGKLTAIHLQSSDEPPD